MTLPTIIKIKEIVINNNIYLSGTKNVFENTNNMERHKTSIDKDVGTNIELTSGVVEKLLVSP